MHVLLVHPGATYSVADVESGVRAGLTAHGIGVHTFRLDHRIRHAHDSLGSWYRYLRKKQVDAERPNSDRIMYAASVDVIEMALRLNVEWVVIVTGMYLHPDAIVLMRRAGLKLAVLLTESPYDLESELRIASLCHVAWTNERATLDLYRDACPRTRYLPAAWHPARHDPRVPLEDVPAHDVVFVGTAFPDRVELLSAIDWTGIDLGLYGNWRALGSRHRLRRFVRDTRPIPNERAAALYRRAKINLNLHRPTPEPAESMNPRAYELARLGVFWIDDGRRLELRERFGYAVPTFSAVDTLGPMIREYLATPARRLAHLVANQTTVGRDSWTDRAAVMVRDLEDALESPAPGAEGRGRSEEGDHNAPSRSQRENAPVHDGQRHGEPGHDHAVEPEPQTRSC